MGDRLRLEEHTNAAKAKENCGQYETHTLRMDVLEHQTAVGQFQNSGDQDLKWTWKEPENPFLQKFQKNPKQYHPAAHTGNNAKAPVQSVGKGNGLGTGNLGFAAGAPWNQMAGKYRADDVDQPKYPGDDGAFKHLT